MPPQGVWAVDILALETCSVEVQRGVEWLKSNVDVDETDWEYADVVYVLKKFDQDLAEKYLEQANDESFWSTIENLFSQPYTLGEGWFLAKLGLNDNPFYLQKLSQIKAEQNRAGYIWNPDTHASVLRTLVLLEPDSDYTEKAVHYWIYNPGTWSVTEIAVGVLALTELNCERYQHEINTGIDTLFSHQNEVGRFSSSGTPEILISTSWAIQAISRSRGSQDFSVHEAINWLKQQQNGDGSWTSRPANDYSAGLTAIALLALISAGEGPKISLAEVEWKEALRNQRTERTKLHFVHTAPISNQRMPVKDIYLKIESMLDSAETEIKILSPYMNLMYDHIIGLAKNNPDLTIKIVTRNLSDTKGKIGRNALDLLKKVTKGEIRENEILHARMIIVDDKEALISSADLTRDQLIDEFNAGVWVRDKETVKRATDFFDNIWEESEIKK